MVGGSTYTASVMDGVLVFIDKVDLMPGTSYTATVTLSNIDGPFDAISINFSELLK